MGMAYQSPGGRRIPNGSRRVPSLRVTNHAIIRFRDRVPEKVQLDDRSLKRLIEEAIKHSAMLGLVEFGLDREHGEDSLLADITETLDSTLAVAKEGAFAIIKKDRITPGQDSVISIYERSMIHNFFEPLGKQPRGLEALIFNPALRKEQAQALQSVVVQPSPPTPPVLPVPPRILDVSEPAALEYLVLAVTGDVVCRGGIEACLQYLSEHTDHSLRLFRELRTRVRVELVE